MYEDVDPAHKIMLVGEGGTGKTCMLEVLRRNRFPDEYIPTVVDNFIREEVVDGKTIRLAIWDTAGQESYSSVRTIAYSDTEMVIMCYSIDDTDSLCAIESKWLPEMKNYIPNAEIVLVGLKCDLRDDGEHEYISTRKGEETACRISARLFYESSARKNYNVAVIFNEAAKLLMKKKSSDKNNKWFCCYLC
ncbi:hypothetical protein COBT_001783 [Conglomerata obtusa]